MKQKLLLIAAWIGICGFLHGAILPVSVPGTFIAASGGSGDSLAPLMTPDGRYVVFASLAKNLVLGTNGLPWPNLGTPRVNVYLRDRTNQTTVLVSVNQIGTDGGNGDSYPTAISTNGQFVLFESTASNLVAGDSNNVGDIFVRDVVHGVTTLVSVSDTGGAANGISRSSVMTPDGRYVAFVSAATNLVVGDTNGIPDIFVRDLQEGVTSLASARAQAGTNASSSELPTISTNGRYVAFYSTATNVVAGVTNSGEIFVTDLVAGTTTWVSAAASSILNSVESTSNALCCNFSISDDGAYIAYEAVPIGSKGYASSLTGGVILRYGVLTGLTDLINTNALGILSGSELNTHTIDMTPDGASVAFIGNVGSVYGTTSIEVWNAQSKTTIATSVGTNGSVPSGLKCYSPALDASGRYVAFFATGPGLANNSPTTANALYRYDTQEGTTQWIDANTYSPSTPNNITTYPRLTPDGNSVTFESLGEGLVANDYNHVYNVFACNVAAGTAELISVHAPSLSSPISDGPSTVTANCISTNGRYVAYYSEADNLVPNDTNGFGDVFVRDTLAGSNYLVSVSNSGTGSGNNLSYQPAISGTGRYVAFTSYSSNLVANDTNNVSDIFLRDLQSNTTTLVSTSASGGAGNGPSSSPVLSADGRYVLFRSYAGNLISPGASNTLANLFWRDTQAGITRALTTAGVGLYAMSPGGQTIAFIEGDYFYIWNSVSNRYLLTNYSGSSFIYTAISPNGQRIAYVPASGALSVYDLSSKSNYSVGTLVGSPPLNVQFTADSQHLVFTGHAGSSTTNQVFLYSFQTGTNALVSSNNLTAAAGNARSDSPAVSPDGAYVAYRSQAANLVPQAGNGFRQILLYSTAYGTNSVVTLDASGLALADNHSLVPMFNAGSDTLVFESFADDLAYGNYSETPTVYTFQPYSVFSSSNSVAPFILQGLTWTGESLENPEALFPSFEWTAQPGLTYQVQFKNSLEDPFWQPLTNNVSILGGLGEAIDLSADGAQRFYRVVAQ
jgi:hypothetical protein